MSSWFSWPLQSGATSSADQCSLESRRSPKALCCSPWRQTETETHHIDLSPMSLPPWLVIWQDWNTSHRPQSHVTTTLACSMVRLEWNCGHLYPRSQAPPERQLHTSAQLQCLGSRLEEPGNEARPFTKLQYYTNSWLVYRKHSNAIVHQPTEKHFSQYSFLTLRCFFMTRRRSA